MQPRRWLCAYSFRHNFAPSISSRVALHCCVEPFIAHPTASTVIVYAVVNSVRGFIKARPRLPLRYFQLIAIALQTGSLLMHHRRGFVEVSMAEAKIVRFEGWRAIILRGVVVSGFQVRVECIHSHKDKPRHSIAHSITAHRNIVPLTEWISGPR